jgi:hypothetical protein
MNEKKTSGWPEKRRPTKKSGLRPYRSDADLPRKVPPVITINGHSCDGVGVEIETSQFRGCSKIRADDEERSGRNSIG